MLAEENMAEKRVIVGSLEVLQDIKGGNIKTIQKNVDSLSLGLQTVAAKQADFFKNISDDAVITPTEKATLKKEFESIVNSYLAILDLAEKKQVLETNELQEYRAAYNDLHDYLYIELRVFDDMSTNTFLQNPETFNEKFDVYYNKEIFANNRCAVGNDYWTLRILDNLSQVGTDNEVALYEGKLYKYSIFKAKWEEIDTAQYLGVKNIYEEANLGDYFLAVQDRIETFLIINEEGFFTNEDLVPIRFSQGIIAGFIYLKTINGWEPVTNKNDWRYIIAQNDLLANGFELSPALKDYLSSAIAQNSPHYLGSLLNPPIDYGSEDWFTWKNPKEFEWEYKPGVFVTLKKGHVYKYNKPTWTELDPADSRYNNEFMTALNDLVELNMGTDGYFVNLFIKKIFAMQAVITELSTKIIKLQNNGAITSEDYIPGEKGIALKAVGSAQLDNVSIIQDGSDNWAFRTEGFERGSTKGVGITKNGELYAKDGEFSGLLNTAFIKNQRLNMEARTVTIPNGTEISIFAERGKIYNSLSYGKVNGTYKGISFSYIEFQVASNTFVQNPFINVQVNTTGYADAFGNVTTTGSGNGTWDGLMTDIVANIILFDENKTIIATFRCLNKLDSDITMTFEECKKDYLRLLNLPTQKPDEPGFLYEESGFIKIS